MKLIIVRHGLAAEPDASKWRTDEDRPLTAEGHRRFSAVAVGLARREERMTAVWSSPFLRARETAAILERDARWPRARLTTVLTPGSRPRLVVDELQGEAKDATIALVSHNPLVSLLLSHLLPKDERAFEFQPGDVAIVSFTGAPTSHEGRLEAFVPSNPGP